MANGQTVILASAYQRALAKQLIDKAPESAVVNIREARRTTEQNDKMWAMIADVSRAKPEGRIMDADAWKGMFMHMAGHPVRFEPALDGNGIVCLGYKSSRLSVADMSDLIEQIPAYGATHGVKWSDGADRRYPDEAERAA